MKYIKKISDYAVVGGLGAVLVTGLVGCDGNNNQNQQAQNSGTFSDASQKQNAFIIVEQLASGGYTIVDEFPSSKTTVVLRQQDGTERILTQAEIDALVMQEEKRIDNGTSPLTNPEVSNGGMSLGGVLLSSIAGAMIGSYLGNKLFNNQNFQNQRQANYKSPQAYSKSVNSFNKATPSKTSSTASKKSGFFGSRSGTTTRSSFFGG
jgi:hypothetical protein